MVTVHYGLWAKSIQLWPLNGMQPFKEVKETFYIDLWNLKNRLECVVDLLMQVVYF